MPLVSVVIPTLGRSDLVRRALASALAQTVREIEVIVVIDGDDPATRDALSAIRDDRLRILAHPQNRGAGAARDTGADAATADWVAFLDDDDEWLPDKLAAQLAAAPAAPAIVMTQSRVVSAAAAFVQPSRAYDGRRPVDEWLFDRTSWTKGGEGFLQCSSLMMPRALFRLVRFADTKQHDDWEFVIRAVKQHGYALVTVERPLVIYHVPETRASLSRTHTWARSIEWAESLGPLLTRRAFSGFCLSVAAQIAASQGATEGFAPLLAAALRHGAPTPKQLFAFAYFRLSPVKLRRRLRAWMQSERAQAGA